MPCPVEITVCDIGIFFQADNVEYVIPVCDFPRINVFGVFVAVLPEKQGIPCCDFGTVMRVAGHNDGILCLCLKEYLLVAPACGDEFLDIDEQDMCRFFR